MTYSRLLTVFLLVALAMSGPVAAAGKDKDEEARQAIRDQFPELIDADIRPSPLPGLYEINIGPQISYISADGRYLVQGDLYDVEEGKNLTESRRIEARTAEIERVGESSMIVFAPEEVKRTITVFTDIDCGYCRKLHREIAGYNGRGIKVRYMFYPRSGPQTESWFKAENVWCSPDRNRALTKAKRGDEIESRECGVTPVAQHYDIGKSFGIQGTPAIVLDTGEMIGGYISPEELAEYLGD